METKNLKKLSAMLSNGQEINGYSDEAQKRKDEFASVGKKAMKELAVALGLKTSDINFNKAGIAVSGDLRLMGMFNDEVGIYISMNKDMGLGVLYRTIKHMKDYSGGPNNWMTTTELGDVDKVVRLVKRICKVD